MGEFWMKPIAGLIIMAVLLSACAQKADKIPASYSSRFMYEAYSCEQIRRETDDVVARLNTISGAQDKKANSDAILTGVGVVLFWPALFFTSGAAGPDDYSGEIGQLKGQAEALSGAYRSKGCAA